MSGVPLLRTTERGTFAECQWRWYWSYVKGLEPRRTPTWSWFGRAIHEALAVRYRVGRIRGSMLDTLSAFEAALGEEVRRVWTQGDELDEQEVVDARELGIAMLRGYINRYGKDAHWEVIVTETPMQIDVPHPKTGRIIATYCLTLDAVVYDRVERKVRIVDHKTRSTFPAEGKWEFYDHNRQGKAYLWVAPELLRHMGLIRRADQVDGIIFNCLKKRLPDDRPTNVKGEALNKDGTVSKRQPAPLFHRHYTPSSPYERVRQAHHVAAEAVQMGLVRTGKLEPIKSTTEACPRCTLYEFCAADEISPEDGLEIARHVYSKRDPYADHRLDMQEKDGVWLHIPERGQHDDTRARARRRTDR